MKSTLAAMLLSLAAGQLAAQTVWRCGPDGRSFQAVPCADGQVVALRSAPGDAAVAEAQAVAARERLALARLSGERLAREQEAIDRGLGPAGIRTQAKAMDKPSKHHHKPKKKPRSTKPRESKGPTFRASAAPSPAD